MLTINGDSPKWTGSDSSNWQVGSTGPSSNWALVTAGSATDYIEGDIVLFDDTAGTAGSVVISAANVSPFSTTFNNNTLNYALTSPSSFGIAGSGSLVKSGTGTLLIGTPNSFTGGTTINSGLVQIANGSAFGTGPLALNGGTLSSSDTTPYALANPLAISGSVTLGDATNNGPLIFTATSGTLGNGPLLTVNSPVTINGSLSGTGGLTLAGNSTLTFAGNNVYTGPTTISGGTLQIGNGGTTGALATNSAIVDNSALVYSLAGTASVASLPSAGITGSGTVSAAAGNITLGGNVTTQGSQSYSATASGSLYFGVQVAASTVSLTATGSGSSISLTGDVGKTNPAGNNLILDTSAGNGPINLNISIGRVNDWYSLNSFTANAGTGAINWSGAQAAGGNQSTPISLTGAINFSSNFVCQTALPMTLNPTGSSTFSGVFSGPMSLIDGGPSSLTISSSNTYTGSTTISGGTLYAANNAALGSNSAVTMNPAVAANLVFSTNAPSIGSLASTNTGASSVLLAAGGIATTLTMGGNNATTTYTGVIGDLALSNPSANGSLNKAGTGAFTMSGTNSYTGVTTVNAGTVNVYNDQSAATGGWNLNGNNLANATTVNFQPGSNIAVAANGFVQVGPNSAGGTSGQTLNSSGTVSNSGSLLVGRVGTMNVNTGAIWNQGGAVLITGVGGFGATLNINAGALLNYTGSNAIVINPGTNSNAGGQLFINGGTLATSQGFLSTSPSGTFNYFVNLENSGVLQLSASIADLTSGTAPNKTQFRLGAGTGVINTNGFTAGISQSISGTGSLTVTGGGLLNLSGANTYSGNTTVNSGTLQLGSAQALGSVNSILSTANSGVVDLNGHSVTIGALGGAGGLITDNSLSGGTTAVTLNLFGSATYGGSIQDGPNTALALSQFGTGKLILTGSSTLGGGLDDTNGGGLEIDGAVATPTFKFGAVIAKLSGSGTIALTSTASGLSYQASGQSTFAGAIKGVGSVAVTSGALTLSGTGNLYSGATTINGGTLSAGVANAFSTSSAITVNSVLDVTAGPQTIAGLTVGSVGHVNLTIGGLLTSLGTIGLNGTLNIFGSTSGSAELLSYPNMTYSSGTNGAFSTVNLNGSPLSGYNLVYNPNELDLVPIVISGPATWNVGTGGSWTTASNWTTNPAPSPSGQGVMAVMGTVPTTSTTVSLDAPQTLGTLVFNNTAGYTLTPGSSGSLTLDNTSGTGDAQIVVLSGSHSILAPLTLAGSNTAVSLTGGGSLTIDGSIFDGSGGTSALAMSSSDGTGLLTLGGTNTYGGGTTVPSGTLVLNGAASLLAGTSLTIGVGVSPGSTFIAPSAAHAAANLAPVPEPGTLLLLAMGGLLLLAYRLGVRNFSTRG